MIIVVSFVSDNEKEREKRIVACHWMRAHHTNNIAFDEEIFHLPLNDVVLY